MLCVCVCVCVFLHASVNVDVCCVTFPQGSESLAHLRKLASNFPTQETGGLGGLGGLSGLSGLGGLGGIEEDDDVPGEVVSKRGSVSVSV